MSSPGDHAPVGYALALVAFAHRGRMQRLLAEQGLHLGQERVVFELAQTPGISQTSLAARLGVEQPTVAKAVARMARQGLVRVEREGRGSRLFLTERGAGLLDGVVGCWREVEDVMVRDLSADERVQLRGLLRRCADNLTGKEPDDDGSRA
ncbi:MarR family winged helix-turn-helix transcriptional regulator [Dactylosporangium darangshiense]|uniref:HTH marR-type domain-containing protein n=1 Tax=Dactylosporangium darangshiense TaxID=579108 RepID=A0ABP8DJG4_9ACTN